MTKPTGCGSPFLLSLQESFSGESGQEAIPGSRGGRGQSLNWRIYLLFHLSLFSLHSRQNVNKFVVLWDRLEQLNVLGWKGLRVGKESPLPSQAKLGKLSLDFPVLGGYHPVDIPTRLELDGRGVA